MLLGRSEGALEMLLGPVLAPGRLCCLIQTGIVRARDPRGTACEKALNTTTRLQQCLHLCQRLQQKHKTTLLLSHCIKRFSPPSSLCCTSFGQGCAQKRLPFLHAKPCVARRHARGFGLILLKSALKEDMPRTLTF